MSPGIEVAEWPQPGLADPQPDLEEPALAAALEFIRDAQRPILYAGGGIICAEAASALRLLAEKASIPVAPTLQALGALPTEHPLNLGMLGMHAAPSTNQALEECDLLIAVGVRFDDRATGKVDAFCPNARIVHIDIDDINAPRLQRRRHPVRPRAGLDLQPHLAAGR